jgi:hypothetical protein
MLVFLDFEASSLGKTSYPIEVGWVFADGRSEEHLIGRAAGWTEWDDEAEAIHHISRDRLAADGEDPEVLARRMIDVLTGHDLLASAPSWDGKWLSTLLRAAGLPRHALRLRRTDDAIAECASQVLAPVLSGDALRDAVAGLIAEARAVEATPAHRALADAMMERERWCRVVAAAQSLAAARDVPRTLR